jgi:hypothetical protein
MRDKSPHGQINVARGSSGFQTQLHRVATFQQPRSISSGEQAIQQAVKCGLSSQALEVDTFFLRHLF